jgi:hypothetical protein
MVSIVCFCCHLFMPAAEGYPMIAAGAISLIKLSELWSFALKCDISCRVVVFRTEMWFSVFELAEFWLFASDSRWVLTVAWRCIRFWLAPIFWYLYYNIKVMSPYWHQFYLSFVMFLNNIHLASRDCKPIPTTSENSPDFNAYLSQLLLARIFLTMKENWSLKNN